MIANWSKFLSPLQNFCEIFEMRKRNCRRNFNMKILDLILFVPGRGGGCNGIFFRGIDSRKEGQWSIGNISPQYKTARIKLQWDVFTSIQKKRHLSHENARTRDFLYRDVTSYFLKMQDTEYRWCFLPRDEIRVVIVLSKNKAIKRDQSDAEKYSFPYVRHIFFRSELRDSFQANSFCHVTERCAKSTSGWFPMQIFKSACAKMLACLTID